MYTSDTRYFITDLMRPMGGMFHTVVIFNNE